MPKRVQVIAEPIEELRCLGLATPHTKQERQFRWNFLPGAISGLTWALFIMGLRWMQRAEASGGGGAAPTVVCANLLAFVFSLPAALPVGTADAGDWAIILYLGVFQIALAYILLTRGLHHLAALEVSLLLILEPVLSVVWAWLVLSEVPGTWALIGGGLILSSTTLKSLLDSRGSQESRQRVRGTLL